MLQSHVRLGAHNTNSLGISFMRFFSRSGCGKFSAVISAGLSAAALLMISGCSVVQVNGTERTADDALCLVRPQIADPALHKLLKDLLTRKRFKVTELAPGTSPNVCRQTLCIAGAWNSITSRLLLNSIRWPLISMSRALKWPMRALTRHAT